MSFHPPSAQELLAAIASALRLSTDPRFGALSPSTRKAMGSGERVRPDTRTEFTFALAAAMLHANVLLHAEAPHGDLRKRTEDLLARGLGEFAIKWDACIADLRTFNPRVAKMNLGVLPLIRLGLADLAVRIGARSTEHRSYLALAETEVAEALVDGTAFIESVRYLLKIHGSRRARLVEKLGVEIVRGWETGALPNDKALRDLAGFLESKAPANIIQFDLRIVVALVELWRWLNHIGISELTRRRMARGFVEWLRAFVSLSIEVGVAKDELGWGIIRGASHPSLADRLHSLSSTGTFRFSSDLAALGGDWIGRCRIDTGPLNNIPIAAADERAGRDPSDIDRSLNDEELVSAALAFPDRLWAGSKDKALRIETSAEWEATGTSALDSGDFNTAITALSRAIELAPTDPWPRIHQGDAFFQVGDFSTAEKIVREALKLDGAIADARLLMGGILIELGRSVEALAELELARRETAQPAVVEAYRGRAWFSLGSFEEAVVACRAGIAQEPKSHACWEVLALALHKLGRTKEARHAAKQAAHFGSGLSSR